ncbi:hypothetical protein S7711_10913 [Stachybotrys chartarum IBT 7711]|uniref:Uncharacterized protein n=1 Tax=Stachybotrys chartarum (strain CBS 109288 / IBT 7711) TaxID=1280523 RepID=A0A084AV45_STACB|nr:hypothetical protein S7711_10913 [Stachybotrys chartarum IBT 7711]KFA53210.1 hypothetical protein S40293_10679 [Stachybotrys chartarum IBT 40293]
MWGPLNQRKVHSADFPNVGFVWVGRVSHHLWEDLVQGIGFAMMKPERSTYLCFLALPPQTVAATSDWTSPSLSSHRDEITVSTYRHSLSPGAVISCPIQLSGEAPGQPLKSESRQAPQLTGRRPVPLMLHPA